jgi:hypothetical protein
MSRLAVVFGSVLVVACSDSASTSPPTTSTDSATELRVPVPESGRVYVELSSATVATVTGDPKSSLDWDLAFEGFDVFTNSGVSGGGRAGAFGPHDAVVFIGDTAPQSPFISSDKAGGAFLNWYAYAGAPSHALFSRFHVVGVRDGDRMWKVQVLGYYGLRDGASVPALYRVRWAELTASGASPTNELSDLDGTAGGAQALETAESECLDLATGARSKHTPASARASKDWHLCFRRATISVNGEIGGPRGVTAVDLFSEQTATESVATLEKLTAESELAKFDAVTRASFDGKAFRGDRVVSGFGDTWIDRTASPLAPAYAAYLVVGADGQQKFLVAFAAFEAPTTTSPGTVVMRIKPVKG